MVLSLLSSPVTLEYELACVDDMAADGQADANRLRDVRFLQTCGQRLGLSDEVCVQTAAHVYRSVDTWARDEECALSHNLPA